MSSEIVSYATDIGGTRAHFVSARTSKTGDSTLHNVAVVHVRGTSTSQFYCNINASWKSRFLSNCNVHLLTQHTPNPLAQDPSFKPFFDEHSSLKLDRKVLKMTLIVHSAQRKLASRRAQYLLFSSVQSACIAERAEPFYLRVSASATRERDQGVRARQLLHITT